MISSHGCKLTRVFNWLGSQRTMFQVPVSGASRCWRVGVQIRSWTWRRSGARAGNGLNWIWVWSSYLKNNHIRGVMRRNVPPPSWQLVTHLERFITHILISSPFKWETESVTERWEDYTLDDISLSRNSSRHAVELVQKAQIQKCHFNVQSLFFKLLFMWQTPAN